MAKLNSLEAIVALKSFLSTGLVFSLVSCGCVYYHVTSGISNLIILSITLIIWLVYTRFKYKDPYEFQVIWTKYLHFWSTCQYIFSDSNKSNNFGLFIHCGTLCEDNGSCTFSNFWGLHVYNGNVPFQWIYFDSHYSTHASDHRLFCDKP